MSDKVTGYVDTRQHETTTKRRATNSDIKEQLFEFIEYKSLTNYGEPITIIAYKTVARWS